MGYITVIARLLGIYGNVNRPCPRASPSDSGRFTAINPYHPCYNYYLIAFVLASYPGLNGPGYEASFCKCRLVQLLHVTLLGTLGYSM